MTWSKALADFVSSRARPEFRQQATYVIRELDKFDNPEAENGIAPMDAGGAIGIGINYQPKILFLITAIFFFGFLAVMVFMLGPVRLRDPGGDLSAWILIIPMFGGFGLLGLLLYLKKPGPEVVVLATPTTLYLLSRTGLRTTPKEVVMPWAENTARVEMKSVTNKGITTHTVALLRVRRDSGRKSRLFSTRVDEQLFRYWQQFANEIARFM